MISEITVAAAAQLQPCTAHSSGGTIHTSAGSHIR